MGRKKREGYVKATKIFQGKKWTVRNGFLITKIWEHLRQPHLNMCACANLIETNSDHDAVFISPFNAPRTCPLCSSKDCFIDVFRIEHPFNKQKAYGRCICKKTKKQFIVEKELNKVNPFEKCIFCKSNEIRIEENSSGILDPSFIHKKIEIVCKQCAALYMFMIKYPKDKKHSLDRYSYIAKSIIHYGKHKTGYSRPSDEFFDEILKKTNNKFIYRDELTNKNIITKIDERISREYETVTHISVDSKPQKIDL